MDIKLYEDKFGYLKEAGKRMTEVYEKANRWFDEMKEGILIEDGLIHTSNLFHNQAHKFPAYFDRIGDILHQRHIIQRYGATEEFPRETIEVNNAFEIAVALFDEIEDGLRDFVAECDKNGDYAVARQLEELQVANGKDREAFLLAWKMYEEAETATSYDNWVKDMEEGAD